MDQQEVERLEKLRAQLESEMDWSSEETWYASWERAAQVFLTGDIYPATMAARVLTHHQPRGALPPKTVAVFSPLLRELEKAAASDEIEGQALMTYRAKKALAKAEQEQREKRAEEAGTSPA